MVYLDYNAQAPLLKEARAAMIDTLDYVGNPSSVHGAGRCTRKFMETARQDIAVCVNAQSSEIIFTSGASEANVQVVRTLQNIKAEIWMSAMEHSSILEAVGDKYNLIPATTDGVIDVNYLAQSLQQSTAVHKAVIVMAANNETGVIQPIKDVSVIANQYSALLFVDATQALGRIPVDFRDWNVDYMTCSSHKVGGPLGAGALIVRKDRPLNALIVGGGQEQNRRAGTHNVSAIVGFAAAVKTMIHFDWNPVQQLRNTMEQRLQAQSFDVIMTGQNSNRLNNTSCIHMPGVSNQTQVMGFDLAGFAISAGSACSSGKVKPSTVLKAMGFNDIIAQETIRVSLCPQTTMTDIDGFVQTWLTIKQRADKNDHAMAA